MFSSTSVSANPNSVYGCILVTSDRKVLVIRGRKSGKWSFPKGHSEQDESELDAAIRETKEETGLLLNTWYQQAIQLATGVYFVYRYKEQPCIPLDTNEVTETRWVSFETLRKMNVNVDINTFLRNYSYLLRKSDWNSIPFQNQSVYIS